MGVESFGGFAHFLGQREVLVVENAGGFLELFLFFAAESLRNFNLYDDVLVAGSVARTGDAFSAHPEDFSAFGAGWELQFGVSVDGRDLYLAAEHGGLERHGHFADNIEVVAFEEFVFANVENDVEIARGTTASTAFTSTRNA